MALALLYRKVRGFGEALKLNSFSDGIRGLPPTERFIDKSVMSVNNDSRRQSEVIPKRGIKGIAGEAFW
ncbi:MAG: hypothetical protein ACP5T2_03290 [Thermoprotei archaeon]